MKKTRQPPTANPTRRNLLGDALFWVLVALLVLVPLVFSSSVYRAYVTPKLAVLLVGASLLAGLAALDAARRGKDLQRLFNPALFVVVTLYVASISISTLFGIDPVASLFGYFHNQMGLVPKLCFFVVYAGVTLAIGGDESRLRKLMWAMALTGFVASAYAVVQFFGYDPIIRASLYTYGSQAGRVRRVMGTLGHADYLGNFLLYTTPLGGALALATKGRARLLGWVAGGVSLAAMVMTGTRGAWLGGVVAAMVVGLLEFKRGKKILAETPRALLIRRAAVVTLIIAVAAGAVALSGAARGLAIRARSFAAEGYTGAGRSLLWRDTLKMLPRSALVGTGPDSFRLAFLAYESKEVARLTGGDNDSSHNAYLDAAIAYGVPGGLLYVAAIVLALRLLLRAHRRAPAAHVRILVTGLLAALVAVAVHNFFIFDQLPTGLYFFALIALAQVAARLVETSAGDATRYRSSRPWLKPQTWAIGGAGGALVVAALWYAVGVLRADRAINQAMAAASRGDLEAVVAAGEQVTRSPEPTGDYHLMMASAFGICSSSLEATGHVAGQAGDQQSARDAQRARELGLAETQQALAHSFAPDVGYLFQAALARDAGDTARARDSALEAARLHPHNYRAHIILANAYTDTGKPDEAAREAETALDLRPFALEAARALARARGEDVTDDAAALKIIRQRRANDPRQRRSAEQLLEVARNLAQAGKLQKARVKLLVAITRAAGACPDCHRELAIVCERMGRYADAIAEWRAFLAQAPAGGAVEEVNARIKTLEAKGVRK